MNRIRRHERGAVATIVGLLLGGAVLFGILAIGVDAGGLLWERRQLQNAADAAALSLAEECYKSPTSCVKTLGNTGDYANNNSADGLAQVVSACSVNIVGSPIDGCPAPSSGITECPPLPPGLDPVATPSMVGLPYVEVRTASKTSGGNFASTWFVELMGNSSGTADSDQPTVNACSRAAVGAPGSGNGDVPITFSACDWQAATGGVNPPGGRVYWAPPVYTAANPDGYGPGNPWPAAAATPPAVNPGGEVILLTANPSNNDGNGNNSGAAVCPDWNGHPLPGGFGTLETIPGNDCSFKEYDHHWMHTSTGNNVACNLDNLVGSVIQLPVFDCTAQNPAGAAPPIGDCTQGTGNGAFYHRAGYASFYLSGYQINIPGNTANKHKSILSGQFPCNGGDRCISGWFVKGELSATAVSGAPSGTGFFGTFSVVPAG